MKEERLVNLSDAGYEPKETKDLLQPMSTDKIKKPVVAYASLETDALKNFFLFSLLNIQQEEGIDVLSSEVQETIETLFEVESGEVMTDADL